MIQDALPTELPRPRQREPEHERDVERAQKVDGEEDLEWIQFEMLTRLRDRLEYKSGL